MKIPHILKYDSGDGGRAFGPLIRINKSMKHDEGLLAHEIEHVKQWWVVSIICAVLWFAFVPMHGLGIVFAWLPLTVYQLLQEIPPIQKLIELRCWRVQLSKYGECRANQAAKLFSTKYHFKISEEEAYQLLKRKEVVL